MTLESENLQLEVQKCGHEGFLHRFVENVRHDAKNETRHIGTLEIENSLQINL